jgi:hypothetical protein
MVDVLVLLVAALGAVGSTVIAVVFLWDFWLASGGRPVKFGWFVDGQKG